MTNQQPPDFTGNSIMASSDDFKALLKAGNITEALALALSEAVELKFTTWVASGDDVEATQAKPGNRLHTRINTIEGEVEHEIGEEFIGNGPYRELRQFHLDQVAEGSKIVQNNLKSLQKLFEVLVALRYQDTETPVIEPGSLEVESQALPPVENVPDAGLVVEPQEAAVTDSVVSPDIVTDEGVLDAGLVVEPQEAAVADSVVSPDIVTEEDVPQEPILPPEEPGSFPTTPTQEQEQALEEETDEEDDDDDWDDSVLDLLESLPVVPPPTSETSDSDLRENWGWEDFTDQELKSDREASDSAESEAWETLRREDFGSPPASAEQNLHASNARVDEDWSDFVDEEPESHREASESRESHVWETLRREDFGSPPASGEPNLHASDSQMDEDWGDFTDEEPEPDRDKAVPSIDSLDLEEDEEWDDWVMEEPEPLLDTPLIDIDSLEDLEDDEDWGDLVEDSESLTKASTHDIEASDLESDEDWDDFADEELQSPSARLEVDTERDRSVGSPGSMQDQTFPKSEFSTDEQIERLPQKPEMTNPSADTVGNPGKMFSGETQPQASHPESAIPDDNKVYSLEEVLFDEVSPAQDLALPEESETAAQEKADAKPKSVEKRMPPPPPPPSRFPKQNS
jgi:hypothetical protein